ncbi:unnamed protein product [Calypogeia fissa]
MRRELGLCKGATRRDRTFISAQADLRFGRWQRSHNLVFVCCVFIIMFSASLTTVCYRNEPSIWTSATRQPLSRWYPQDLANDDDEKSALNRRILSGALQRTLALQQDTVEDHRRGVNFKQVRRETTPEIADDKLIHSDKSTSLGLVTELRIFVYDLPPEYNTDWLNDTRCSSHLFAAEVALHQILLESPLRTTDPDAADFFFVPVYVSCNFSPKNGFPTLGNATKIIRAAVDLISRQMIYWDKSGGSDHIFVATHDYGACFHSMSVLAEARGIPEFLRKSIILQTFGQKDGRHPCQLAESIVIPPYVSPEAVQKHWQPMEHQERSILAHFRGKLELHPKNVSGHFYSKAVRTVIWQKFKKNPLFFVRRKRLDGYQSEMLRSKFCLAPLGWAPWSPRIVESVVYGCVPVIIADNIALPYSHVIDWPSISITVMERDVDKLDQILLHVEATNLTAIQENLWKEENRRALLYTQPLVEGDASWQIFDLLAEKKVTRDAQKAIARRRESIFGEVQENQ